MYAGTTSPMAWGETWKASANRGMSGATMYAWKKIKNVAAESTRSRRSRAAAPSMPAAEATTLSRGERGKARLADRILQLLLTDLRRLIADIDVLLRHLRPDLPHARQGVERLGDF